MLCTTSNVELQTFFRTFSRLSYIKVFLGHVFQGFGNIDQYAAGNQYDQVHVKYSYTFRSAAVKFRERTHLECIQTETYLFAGTSSSQTPWPTSAGRYAWITYVSHL